jgi:hypothetical protein
MGDTIAFRYMVIGTIVGSLLALVLVLAFEQHETKYSENISEKTQIVN